MARKKMFFDSAEARDELSYKPGPIDEAIKPAIDFFRHRRGKLGRLRN